MKNMLVILKKELKRFFTDRRMLLAMFLPGVLIFALYTVMGNLFNASIFTSNTQDVTYKVAYTDNFAADNTGKPALLTVLDSYLTAEGSNNKEENEMISASKVEEYKTKLKNGEIDLLIEYSNNFEDNYLVNNGTNNINLYYNGESADSENLYSVVTSLVPGAYNFYSLNVDRTTMTPINGNVSENSATLSKIISIILPMVTVSLLFSTVISFCPESISGEKERGTLASILLTPIKRSEFVIGKIIALSIVAILSGVVSFLGLAGSLPGLMGLDSLPFGFGQMALFLLIVISTLLMFVGLGVLISSLSNSVKEASSYLGPFSLIFMVLSFVPLLFGGTNIAFAFIPVVNLSASISGLITQAPNMTLFLALTVLSNLLFTALFVFIVTKLFNKEKVVLGQ